MTNRYVTFEDTVAAYTDDTFTLTAVQHDIDVIAETLTPSRNNIYVQTNKNRTPRRHLQGTLAWDGNIEAPLYPAHTTSLIYYGLGANTTVVDMPTLTLQTHTVTAALTIPDFILGIGRDDVEHDYTGCVVKGFSIEYAPDAALTINADINARKEQAPAVLQMITFSDFDDLERAFGGTEVDPQLGVAESGTPTSVTFVESASVTVENNFVDSLYTLNDQHLSANVVEALAVTGSLEIRFDDDTQYTDVVNDTDKELFLTANHGSAATEREIDIQMSRISYDDTDLSTADTQRFTQTLNWTAEDDSTSGEQITVNVINALLETAFAI